MNKSVLYLPMARYMRSLILILTSALFYIPCEAQTVDVRIENNAQQFDLKFESGNQNMFNGSRTAELCKKTQDGMPIERTVFNITTPFLENNQFLQILRNSTPNEQQSPFGNIALAEDRVFSAFRSGTMENNRTENGITYDLYYAFQQTVPSSMFRNKYRFGFTIESSASPFGNDSSTNIGLPETFSIKAQDSNYPTLNLTIIEENNPRITNLALSEGGGCSAVLSFEENVVSMPDIERDYELHVYSPDNKLIASVELPTSKITESLCTSEGSDCDSSNYIEIESLQDELAANLTLFGDSESEHRLNFTISRKRNGCTSIESEAFSKKFTACVLPTSPSNQALHLSSSLITFSVALIGLMIL